MTEKRFSSIDNTHSDVQNQIDQTSANDGNLHDKESRITFRRHRNRIHTSAEHHSPGTTKNQMSGIDLLVDLSNSQNCMLLETSSRELVHYEDGEKDKEGIQMKHCRNGPLSKQLFSSIFDDTHHSDDQNGINPTSWVNRLDSVQGSTTSQAFVDLSLNYENENEEEEEEKSKCQNINNGNRFKRCKIRLDDFCPNRSGSAGRN